MSASRRAVGSMAPGGATKTALQGSSQADSAPHASYASKALAALSKDAVGMERSVGCADQCLPALDMVAKSAAPMTAELPDPWGRVPGDKSSLEAFMEHHPTVDNGVLSAFSAALDLQAVPQLQEAFGTVDGLAPAAAAAAATKAAAAAGDEALSLGAVLQAAVGGFGALDAPEQARNPLGSYGGAAVGQEEEEEEEEEGEEQDDVMEEDDALHGKEMSEDMTKVFSHVMARQDGAKPVVVNLSGLSAAQAGRFAAELAVRISAQQRHRGSQKPLMKQAMAEFYNDTATPETSAIRSRLDTLTLLHLVEDATKALTEKGIDVVGHIKQMTAAATAGSATAAPPQPAQLQPQTRSTAELDKALEMLLTATDIVPTKAWAELCQDTGFMEYCEPPPAEEDPHTVPMMTAGDVHHALRMGPARRPAAAAAASAADALAAPSNGLPLLPSAAPTAFESPVVPQIHPAEPEPLAANDAVSFAAAATTPAAAAAAAPAELQQDGSDDLMQRSACAGDATAVSMELPSLPLAHMPLPMAPFTSGGGSVEGVVDDAWDPYICFQDDMDLVADLCGGIDEPSSALATHVSLAAGAAAGTGEHLKQLPFKPILQLPSAADDGNTSALLLGEVTPDSRAAKRRATLPLPPSDNSAAARPAAVYPAAVWDEGSGSDQDEDDVMCAAEADALVHVLPRGWDRSYCDGADGGGDYPSGSCLSGFGGSGILEAGQVLPGYVVNLPSPRAAAAAVAPVRGKKLMPQPRASYTDAGTPIHHGPGISRMASLSARGSCATALFSEAAVDFMAPLLGGGGAAAASSAAAAAAAAGARALLSKVKTTSAAAGGRAPALSCRPVRASRARAAAAVAAAAAAAASGFSDSDDGGLGDGFSSDDGGCDDVQDEDDFEVPRWSNSSFGDSSSGGSGGGSFGGTYGAAGGDGDDIIHVIRPHGNSARRREFTKAMLRKVYELPINEAARKLGVGVTVLKKYCRKFNIARWPYRKLQSMDKLIQSVTECGDDPAVSAAVVQELLRFREQILQDPSMEIEERIKKLRQANFKQEYKQRLGSNGSALPAGDDAPAAAAAETTATTRGGGSGNKRRRGPPDSD